MKNEYHNCKICSGNVSIINTTYNLGQCEKCNFIFCVTIFSQEEFIQVYNQLYNDQDALYKMHSVTQYNALKENKKINVGFNRSKLIKKHILNGKCNSVLEIGSGIGLIGAYIRQNNDKIFYKGIELDKEAFDKSQTLGLNTVNADFKEMANLTETYDVITLWEVIEHLQDLKLFLELAHQKLNVGGKIVLSTPNYNKIYNYPNRAKDQLFQNSPPIHLNFFTLQNIKNIFELNNFSDCKAVLKKWPYLEIKSISFYKDIFKSLIGKFQGTTIYFVATKK
ncbi:class I SAM-dependent methyltransferase [Flavobacterium amnicola]|uniref:Class I SAM-dependent methyltransferase n=1 Tax=Flavobacterium amnicola TaxID=2506422 RepID=A0A4V1N1S2_9FLAO|nr:class I SAM-dependent methyltransferase [Flavobacterium amnicola]RXR17745.1 class I SAM-dependent methyltransferase [Flavobacterium amnicola]